jgi:ketosteroid isomerase-like protein
MSQENVEIVLRGIEAFNRGDMDALRAIVAPDFEYVTSGTIPGLTGAYHGLDDFEQRFFEPFWSAFDDTRYEVHEMIDADDRVLVSQTIHGRGKQSAVEVAYDTWQVWTLRDGKVVRGQGFTSRGPALEAVGLRE